MEKLINKIHCMDALEGSRQLPDESVDCVVTSPPYWGLRDYGVEGQTGLEPTLDEYLNKLLDITAELKRVMKPTGVLFWNHGDCYHSTPSGTTPTNTRNKIAKTIISSAAAKQKCIALQNHRLILRMIDEQGWILRNQIIWHKPNCMPSSVKDRFNNSYEPVFMLTKNKKYWFDLDAVRAPHTDIHDYNRHAPFNYRVREAKKGHNSIVGVKSTLEEMDSYDSKGIKKGFDDEYWWSFLHGNAHTNRFYKKAFEIMEEWMIGNQCYDYRKFYSWYCSQKSGSWVEGTLEKGQRNKFDGELPFPNPENRLKGKNPGDLWTIPTQPFPKAHFATFPEKLIEPMIKAGCPEGGIVLDPFMGSGTTALVARKLSRKFIGFELNPEYVKIANKRIHDVMVQKKLSETL